jgi:Putative DNA-binding domain
MAAEARLLIRRNDRMTSLERLEIYSRSYWFRVLDSFREDYPGLRSILGAKRFEAMAVEYLRDRPSASFTLRDLGSRLESWLVANPHWMGREARLALDMARLEWAHIEAFDGLANEPLGADDLAALRPDLRVGLQPYISLLDLHYPVDEMRVAQNSKQEEGGATSNFAMPRRAVALKRVRRAVPEPIWLAVHRLDSSVYYRRLEREEYGLLLELRAGKTLSGALRSALWDSEIPSGDLPQRLQTWFRTWAKFGWLTRRARSAR